MLSRRHAPRRNQRGDIMLVTMVFLLLCLLGLIGSMRDNVVATNLAGNNLMRQKDTQVADLALQSVRNQILANNVSGTSLASSPGIISQAWWRDVAPNSAAAQLPAAYWTTCLNNSDTTQRCGAVTLTVGTTTLPYTALAVVQPTGRTDPYSPQCATGQSTQPLAQAVYYAIFIHVQESNGSTSVNTESVYQTCEQFLPS